MKSIITIIENVYQQAGITSLVLLIVGFIILLISKNSFKDSIVKTITSSVLTFLSIIISIILTIKVDSRFSLIIYPLILNIWYFSFKKTSNAIIYANSMMILAFITITFLVKEILKLI